MVADPIQGMEAELDEVREEVKDVAASKPVFRRIFLAWSSAAEDFLRNCFLVQNIRDRGLLMRGFLAVADLLVKAGSLQGEPADDGKYHISMGAADTAKLIEEWWKRHAVHADEALNALTSEERHIEFLGSHNPRDVTERFVAEMVEVRRLYGKALLSGDGGIFKHIVEMCEKVRTDSERAVREELAVRLVGLAGEFGVADDAEGSIEEAEKLADSGELQEARNLLLRVIGRFERNRAYSRRQERCVAPTARFVAVKRDRRPSPKREKPKTGRFLDDGAKSEKSEEASAPSLDGPNVISFEEMRRDKTIGRNPTITAPPTSRGVAVPRSKNDPKSKRRGKSRGSKNGG